MRESGSGQSAIESDKRRSCVLNMAYNPSVFFPNGYQDQLHPEEEVVTNWVRSIFPIFYICLHNTVSGFNLKLYRFCCQFLKGGSRKSTKEVAVFV